MSRRGGRRRGCGNVTGAAADVADTGVWLTDIAASSVIVKSHCGGHLDNVEARVVEDAFEGSGRTVLCPGNAIVAGISLEAAGGTVG